MDLAVSRREGQGRLVHSRVDKVLSLRIGAFNVDRAVVACPGRSRHRTGQGCLGMYLEAHQLIQNVRSAAAHSTTVFHS